MKKYLLISMLYLNVITLFAQIPELPKSLPSPNAVSLGQYGEVPVSLFTGVPQIEIPLYNYEAKDFNLPISLSYHASGIRPDIRPGWTGLGWTLNAGGMITRIVNDMPDEYNNPYYGYYGHGDHTGYYFTHEILNKRQWSQLSYLKQIAQSNEKWKDTEPDEFRFNFMGYNGRFLLDEKGNWQVQCNKPIKVIMDDDFLRVKINSVDYFDHFYSIKGFTLITEDGVKYIFGGSNNSIEYSIDFFYQGNTEWIATSWHLTKVILLNGDEINFTYERNEFLNQMCYSITQDLGSYTEGAGGGFILECESISYLPHGSYDGKLIAPVYLSKIEANDVQINFSKTYSTELNYDYSVYRSQISAANGDLEGLFPILYALYGNFQDHLKWYKLTEISVCHNTDTIKKIKLNYNDTTSQRLMLLSTEEHGYGDNGTLPPRIHQFKYDNPHLLPPYFSKEVDHWGYYNNRIMSSQYAAHYSTREPNENVLLYGTLNKIIYPTGGYNRFVFEPHRYSKQLNTERWTGYSNISGVAGGLRLKEIINSTTGNTNDEKIFKQYAYSNGVLGGRIKYYFDDYVVRAFNDNNSKRLIKYFSSQSVFPVCENSCGSHIGYTNVTEVNADGSYIKYEFSNFDNGYLDKAPGATIQEGRTPYEPYSSTKQLRGKLLNTKEYTSTHILKKQNTNIYNHDDSKYVRSMKACYKNVCKNTSISYGEGTTYKIYYFEPYLTKEIEEIFENSTTPITTTTEYTYNSYGLPKTITQTLNNSIQSTEFYRISDYPYNYNPVYVGMRDNHILSALINKTITRRDTETNTQTTLRREDITYSAYPEVSSNFFAPSRIYTYAGIGPQSVESMIEFEAYDRKGNPIYIIKNEYEKIAIIWGYKHRYPVLEVRGLNNFSDISNYLGNINTFSGANTPDFSKITNLRNGIRKAIVTSYTYDVLRGLTSITDPRGITTNCEYDGFGRPIYLKNHENKIIKSYQYNYQPTE